MENHIIKSIYALIFLISLSFSIEVNAVEAKSYRQYAADQVLYTTGSITNVRNMPSASGKLNVKLRINSKVKVISNRDEWVYVGAYTREFGWIHKSLVIDKPLDFSQVLADAENKSSNKERRQLIERAAALKPLDSNILEKLEHAYAVEGNTKKAEQLRTRRLNLTKPELPPAPKEQVIFLYENGKLIPFAKVRNKKIVAPYKNEHQADKLILQYYSPGQKFQIKLKNGKYGVIQVTDGTKPGYTGMDGCYNAPSAETRLLGNNQNNLPSKSFATNFALAEPKTQTQNLILSNKDKADLNKIAMNVYRESNRGYLRIPEGGKLAFKEHLTGDVNGDGISDIVSLHTYIINHSVVSQTGYFTLLVSNKVKNGSFKKLYGISDGGSGDAVVDGASLISLADLNNDGAQEITYSTSHYESFVNNILGTSKGRYFSYSFFSGGC